MDARRLPQFAGILALLILAACASNQVKCPGCALLDAKYTCEANALSNSKVLSSSKALSMLYLSGGGPHGAYGAGILAGWSSHGRPTFDVVTGVSTGALIATSAFLGPEYDSTLYQMYTQYKTKDLMRRRPWWKFWQWWTTSVNNVDGLRGLTETLIATHQMIEAVGDQEGKRLLCVGTVNLKSGQFISWDLTKIAKDAKSDPRLEQAYRQVLLASASVPVFSPTVDLAGDPNVDGGVRNQIFAIAKIIGDYRKKRAPHASGDRVYFIVNHRLSVLEKPIKSRLNQVALRTISLMENEVLVGDVALADAQLKRLKPPPQVRYRYICNGYPLNIQNDTFDRREMCRLFCRGRYEGSNDLWYKKLPDLEPRTGCPFPTGSTPPGKVSKNKKGCPYPSDDALGVAQCPPPDGQNGITAECPTSYSWPPDDQCSD